MAATAQRAGHGVGIRLCPLPRLGWGMGPPVPKTLREFPTRCGTEEACQADLEAWRWPEGFRCPRCGHRGASRLARRRLLPCQRCDHQASVTAGTAMHRSKQPLRTWFWAIFLVARQKKGISALQLQADLGIRRYETAWLLLHEIRACFGESANHPLQGVVEVDEALLGNVPAGVRPGRGAAGRPLVVGAVQWRGRRLGDARLAVVPDVQVKSLVPFVTANTPRGATVRTDGWRGYDPLRHEDYRRERYVTVGRRGNPWKPVLPGIHVLFSNLRTWLHGRFHAVSDEPLPA